MNILSFVHLRNIHRSTGAGRVARQLTEKMAIQPAVNLRVLADAGDHRRIIPLVGTPWTTYQYHLFENSTSRQQAGWMLTNQPAAEKFWPAVQVTHCTMESYVPTHRGRLAITVHDAAYFEQGAHQCSLRNSLQRWKWNLLYKILARRADLFHTVSEFSAERLGSFFPAIRSRLRVVPNAPSQRFRQPVSPESERWLSETGLGQRNYVLLPGGLHFRKNADLVLKAWEILRQRNRDVVLVVSGHSDPRYSAAAEALGASIRFLGFIGDDHLCSLYHAAQVVWFPSKYEGFGIPILESMCCGTPVVASDCSSIPEVAGNAAILMPPTDAGAHADALITMLQNSQLRDEYKVRGEKRAEQYSWERSASELHALFQAMI